MAKNRNLQDMCAEIKSTTSKRERELIIYHIYWSIVWFKTSKAFFESAKYLTSVPLIAVIGEGSGA